MTLRFDADRVSGSDGCNRVTSPYTATDASLRIGPTMASTQRACPDAISAQATAFMSALTRARSYRVEAGTLQLLGEDGAVLVTLASQPTTLAGTSWQVTRYNNGKQAVTTLRAGTTLTVVFGPDDTVSGSAGCNTYRGTYSTDGTKVTFGPTGTTRKICDNPDRVMEQEQQFLKALATVAVARFEGDTLELRTAEGALALARDTGR
jgi:heat shock protein HslJ